MFWERIVVHVDERLVLSRNRRFDRILVPGEYHVLVESLTSLESEKHSIANPVFRSRWADYLVRCRPEIVERHFVRVETSATQVGMVYVNGALFQVLVPAKRLLFWRDAAVVTAEITEVVAEGESWLLGRRG